MTFLTATGIFASPVGKTSCNNFSLVRPTGFAWRTCRFQVKPGTLTPMQCLRKTNGQLEIGSP